MLRYASLSFEDIAKRKINAFSNEEDYEDVFLQITGREKSFMAFADSPEEKQEWCMKLAAVCVFTDFLVVAQVQN